MIAVTLTSHKESLNIRLFVISDVVQGALRQSHKPLVNLLLAKKILDHTGYTPVSKY